MIPEDVVGSEKPTRTLPPASLDELDQFKEAVLRLDPGPHREALVSSISVATTQLQKLRDLEATQGRLAREDGVDLSAENTTPAAVLGSEEVLNVHEIFTVTDVLDTEHIRGLAWQAQMPPEAVRKELRAFQKSVAERLAQAVRRTGNAKGAQDGAMGTLQQHPARPVGQGGNLVDDPEAAAAARATMFVKLAKLVSPDTGGILPTPISTVGVFQQLTVGCGDWSVRCALLQALGRSGPEVLGRVVESSKVLDALHTWLQEALDDGQGTVLRLLLGVMGQLPVSRVMLRGSRLESGLESLARGAAGAGAGPGAAEGDAGGALAALRRRFGAAAAAVLEAWRQGTAVPLGRAVSAHGPASALAAMSAVPTAVPGTAGGAAGDAVPRKRLLDGRLAPAAVGRPNGEARGAPRPRVQDAPVGAFPSSGAAAAAASAGAGGGGAAGGAHHPQQQQQRVAAAAAAGTAAAGLAARRAAGSGSGQGLRSVGPGAGGGGAGGAAATGAGAAAVGPTKPDMTAKLGDTGPVDPDVVLGFRSRTGEVRRSQLAGRLGPGGRAGQPAAALASPPAHGTPAAANAAVATAATGPVLGSGGGALGGPHGDVGYDLSQQQGAGGGGAGAGAMDVDADGLGEVDRAELERLRAERRAQRLAASTLAAVQGEARRLPEVAAAERAYRERAESHRKARALRLVAETQRRTSERVAAVAMRPTVAPWPRPPLELLLPPDQQPLGMGEDSTERQVQLAAREHTPKASYATSDAVPPSPAEPPAADPPAPPARPFPWLPSTEEEDGPSDWYRQNLQAWEAGTRLPDFALPPALLHKHLRLDPRVVAPPPTPAPPQHQHQHQQPLPPHRPSPPPATLLPAAASAAPLLLQGAANTLVLQPGPPGAPLLLVLQPGPQGLHQQALPVALQQPPAPVQQQGWWPQDAGQQQPQPHHPQHVPYGQQDYRPAADPYYAPPTNGRAGYEPVPPQGQGPYEQPYSQRGARHGRYPDEWPQQQQGPAPRGQQGYGGRGDEAYYDAPAAEYYGGPGEGTGNGYGTGRRDGPYRQQQQRPYETYEPVGSVHHGYPAQDQRGYGRHNRR